MTQAVVSCTALALLYVGALHCSGGGHRDDRAVIRRRSGAVALVCCVAWLPVAWLPVQPGVSLPARLGLRTNSAAHGAALGLVLCAVLFAAPLRLRWREGGKHSRASAFRDLFVAPVAEEFVFRGCMLPLLSSAQFRDATLVLSCPLFFGAAHLHHAWELHTCAYTSAFGALATLLLLRTGTLAAPLSAHMFCNWMGLPAFWRILGDGLASRLLLLTGVAAFAGGVTMLWRTANWHPI